MKVKQGDLVQMLAGKDRGKQGRILDARPSDAIALALRTRAPIHVAKQVLVQSSYVQECESTGDQNLSNVSPDQWADILEKMAPDDFKYKM